MAEVDELALAKAIRAVDDKVWALQGEIDSSNPEDEQLCDLEDELLGYMKAATKLKESYEEAIRHFDNLVPYEKLVRAYPKKSTSPSI